MLNKYDRSKISLPFHQGREPWFSQTPCLSWSSGNPISGGSQRLCSYYYDQDRETRRLSDGRRFEELERQRETFFRRWLKLRGINEFCGDADWVHQRWESYIYGLQRGYKSGTFMIKRFKMGTWRVHRWKNRLRTHTAQLCNSDLFETMMKITSTHVKRQQFTI